MPRSQDQLNDESLEQLAKQLGGFAALEEKKESQRAVSPRRSGSEKPRKSKGSSDESPRSSQSRRRSSTRSQERSGSVDRRLSGISGNSFGSITSIGQPSRISQAPLGKVHVRKCRIFGCCIWQSTKPHCIFVGKRKQERRDTVDGIMAASQYDELYIDDMKDSRRYSGAIDENELIQIRDRENRTRRRHSLKPAVKSVVEAPDLETLCEEMDDEPKKGCDRMSRSERKSYSARLSKQYERRMSIQEQPAELASPVTSRTSRPGSPTDSNLDIVESLPSKHNWLRGRMSRVSSNRSFNAPMSHCSRLSVGKQVERHTLGVIPCTSVSSNERSSLSAIQAPRRFSIVAVDAIAGTQGTQVEPDGAASNRRRSIQPGTSNISMCVPSRENIDEYCDKESEAKRAAARRRRRGSQASAIYERRNSNAQQPKIIMQFDVDRMMADLGTTIPPRDST